MRSTQPFGNINAGAGTDIAYRQFAKTGAQQFAGNDFAHITVAEQHGGGIFKLPMHFTGDANGNSSNRYRTLTNRGFAPHPFCRAVGRLHQGFQITRCHPLISGKPVAGLDLSQNLRLPHNNAFQRCRDPEQVTHGIRFVRDTREGDSS